MPCGEDDGASTAGWMMPTRIRHFDLNLDEHRRNADDGITSRC